MSDAKFFEGILNDKFVMREGGRQMDKAAVVKFIVDNKCNIKDWKLEDALMARIDPDTYVLSYRGTFDGSCAGPDGKPIEESQARSALRLFGFEPITAWQPCSTDKIRFSIPRTHLRPQRPRPRRNRKRAIEPWQPRSSPPSRALWR